MAFLTTTDYDSIIDATELGVLTGSSATVRELAESQAISKIKHALAGKFDVDAIFGATGEDRDLTVVEYTIYYSLYILYTKIARSKVPGDRYAQYKEAVEFFKAVSTDLIQSNLPRLESTDDDNYFDFRFGSDTPYGCIY